jgi:RimJ/RimL family protein N-acetyltransferase
MTSPRWSCLLRRPPTATSSSKRSGPAARFIRPGSIRPTPPIASPPTWRATREDQAAYLVRHCSCGSLVGFVSVNNIVRGALQSGYLGYAAFASHAGRGLMTGGLRAVIDTVFGDLALHRVEANIQPANVSSIGLVRRLGFEKEGFSRRYLRIDGDWRDHERWALLADEWRAHNGLA